MPPILTLEWKERTQHHRASLPITDSTVRAALDLVSRVLPLKHHQLYVDGDHIEAYTVKSVLACYATGLTSSRMAYCWIAQPLLETAHARASFPVAITLDICTGQTTTECTIPDPPKVWMWPCRCSIASIRNISSLHPATIRQQVEATLASAQVHWCPRLQNLDEWELLQWGKRGARS